GGVPAQLPDQPLRRLAHQARIGAIGEKNAFAQVGPGEKAGDFMRLECAHPPLRAARMARRSDSAAALAARSLASMPADVSARTWLLVVYSAVARRVSTSGSAFVPSRTAMVAVAVTVTRLGLLGLAVAVKKPRLPPEAAADTVTSGAVSAAERPSRSARSW